MNIIYEVTKERGATAGSPADDPAASAGSI
jgi:hypothetical protein